MQARVAGVVAAMSKHPQIKQFDNYDPDSLETKLHGHSRTESIINLSKDRLGRQRWPPDLPEKFIPFFASFPRIRAVDRQ